MEYGDASGTGNIRPGVVTVSLGTSGTICAFSEEALIDPKGQVAAFCDATDHWLQLTCTMTGAAATENMTPDFMARAVVEGVTLGLAYGLRRFRDLGIELTEIRLTWGGSKSAVWRQIATDVLGLATVALRVAEGAALGAAIQAAWTFYKLKGKPVKLAKLIDDLVVVAKKTRLELEKANTVFYREQLLRQIDLTKKLKTGGYL